MKRQLEIFLTALMFYTRIPVTSKLRYSNELLNRSTRYITLIGLLVGGIGAGIFLALNGILPQELALLISMFSTIFLTGAFHEDGFADFCDGFGGGVKPEHILEIMKDSRLGTYGAIGMLGMLASKYAALNAIPENQIALVILAGHSLSRLMPVIIIFTSDYARTDAKSKTKPVGKRSKTSDLLIASLFSLGMLCFFDWKIAAITLPVLLLVTWIFKSYTEKRIGGYTGDCLGALQQISEVLFYILFLMAINSNF